MILIFGGAYQGKCQYAQDIFHYTDDDVYTCQPQLSALQEACKATDKPIIYGIEAFVHACCDAGVEAKDELLRYHDQLKHRILIACDSSQGLVPMDPADRAFREMMGRTMLYLSKEAEQVYRVFCGLGQRLK